MQDSPLAAILGLPEAQRPDPVAGAGLPEAQADRLRDFWAIYGAKPEAKERFKVGQLVQVDPALAHLFPVRFPGVGYPAILVSLDPEKFVGRLAPQNPSESIVVSDVVVGVILKGRNQDVFMLYTADSRFLEPWKG